MSDQAVQSNLQPGDIVRLRSGSPAMTVSSVGANSVSTYWFHNGELRQGVLPLVTIRDEADYGAEARYRNER